MTSFEAKMATLDDHRNIQRQLAVYCIAVDRRDESLLRSVYHDDAYDDHAGEFAGPVDEFIPWVLTFLANDTFGFHQLGQSIIDIDGDRATAETYWTSHRGIIDDDGGSRVVSSGGLYLDRFERRDDDRWRIAQRTVTRTWRA